MAVCIQYCCEDEKEVAAVAPSERVALISVQPQVSSGTPPRYSLHYSVGSLQLCKLQAAVRAYQVACTDGDRDAAKVAINLCVRSQCIPDAPDGDLIPVDSEYDEFVRYLARRTGSGTFGSITFHDVSGFVIVT